MNVRRTAILLGAVLLGAVGLLVFTQYAGDGPSNSTLLGGFTETRKETEVDTVELERNGAEKLVFVSSSPGRWELRQPTAARVDSRAVQDLVKAVWSAKPVRYDGLGTNLATHGLASPTFSVTLGIKGVKSPALTLGDTTIGGSEAVTFAVTSDRADTPVAIRTSELRPLFRDTAALADGAAAPKAKWLGDYRSKRLFDADALTMGADLLGLKMAQGGKSFALTHAKDQWRFEQPASYGEADFAGDANPSSEFYTGVRPLLALLLNLQAGGPADFLDVPPAEFAKYGLAADDPQAIRIELKPKGDAPPEVVWLGKAAEGPLPTKVYARREGDPGVVQVTTDRLAAIAGTAQHADQLRNRDFLPEVSKDRIDAIDLAVKGDVARLRRFGTHPTATWKAYTANGVREVNKFAVAALIEALAKPRSAKAILAEPNPNAFNPPEIQGEVKVWLDGQEKPAAPDPAAEPKVKETPSAAFTVGRIDADGSFLRRTMGTETTDYKIAADIVATLVKPKIEYYQPTLTQFDPMAATELLLARPGGVVEVKKVSPPEEKDSRWVFVQPADRKDKPADGPTILRLLATVSNFQARKVVADNPSPDDAKKWQIDPAAPRMKLSVRLQPEVRREYFFGAEADDKVDVYFKVADQPLAMLVPKPLFSELADADFRDRTLYRVDPSKLNKIVLRGWRNPADGTIAKLTLTRTGDAWACDPPEIAPDAAKMKALIETLRAPRLLEFVPEVKIAEQGLTPEQGSLQIFVFEDGKPDPILLDLGKEDPGRAGRFATCSTLPGTAFKLESPLLQAVAADRKTLQK